MIAVPRTCSRQHARTLALSKNPLSFMRRSSRSSSAQALSGPDNQRAIGLENPDFGRSTSVRGT